MRERQPGLPERKIVNQFQRHLVEKLRRLGRQLFAVDAPFHRMSHVQILFRPRDGHIAKSALFLELSRNLGFLATVNAERAVLEAHNKNDWEFQAFGRVSSQQCDGDITFVLIGVGHQCRMVDELTQSRGAQFVVINWPR